MYNKLLTTLALAGLAMASPVAVDSPLSSLQLHQRQAASVPTLPFNLTYAFTANLNLGLPNKPIPIPGGILLTEPIANGTVSGPLINATVHGGLATPYVYYNQTIQAPRIYIYGVTSDGRSFLVEETGIGRPNWQVTRISLSVNTTGDDGYEKLRDGFILASVSPNANGTQVQVHGWLVDNDAAFMA